MSRQCETNTNYYIPKFPEYCSRDTKCDPTASRNMSGKKENMRNQLRLSIQYIYIYIHVEIPICDAMKVVACNTLIHDSVMNIVHTGNQDSHKA